VWGYEAVDSVTGDCIQLLTAIGRDTQNGTSKHELPNARVMLGPPSISRCMMEAPHQTLVGCWIDMRGQLSTTLIAPDYSVGGQVHGRGTSGKKAECTIRNCKAPLDAHPAPCFCTPRKRPHGHAAGLRSHLYSTHSGSAIDRTELLYQANTGYHGKSH